MKALIHGVRVCQIEKDGDVFPVSPNMQWIDCDNTITTRHTYVDGGFVVPEEYTTEWKWQELRKNRNFLLLNSDWTQVSDAKVDVEAWATYRQTLRDLPDNTDDPNKPTWPTKPE